MEKSLELKEKENKGKKGICRIELQVYGTLEKRVELKKLNTRVVLCRYYNVFRHQQI